MQQKALLSDHLIGDLLEMHRHRKAKSSGGLEVEHKLKFGRLLDGQVRRLCAFEYLSGVHTSLPTSSSETWSITHQTANGGELTKLIARRNGMS